MRTQKLRNRKIRKYPQFRINENVSRISHTEKSHCNLEASNSRRERRYILLLRSTYSFSHHTPAKRHKQKYEIHYRIYRCTTTFHLKFDFIHNIEFRKGTGEKQRTYKAPHIAKASPYVCTCSCLLGRPHSYSPTHRFAPLHARTLYVLTPLHARTLDGSRYSGPEEDIPSQTRREARVG